MQVMTMPIVRVCFGVIFIISGYALVKAAHKWHDVHKNNYNYTGMGRDLFIVFAICCWISALTIVVVQVLEFIKGMI